ncbi:MAG: hypothetical protein HQL76_01890 [Magnetococcales bacterium]|nr:hypothetical protein [Magnetococcales bacterium]
MTLLPKRNPWTLPGWGLFFDPEPFKSEEIPIIRDGVVGVVHCLSWNREGTLLAVATDEGLFLKKVETGCANSSSSDDPSWKPVLSGTFSTIVFGNDNRLILVDRRGMILPCLVLDDLKIQVGKALMWNSGGSWLPSFSDDAKLLVAPADGGGIGLYFPYGSETDWKLLPEPNRPFEQAVISPNKKWLAYSQTFDNGSRVFVLPIPFDDGEEWWVNGVICQKDLNLGYGFSVSCLVFNGDATVLYVGGTNHRIITFVNDKDGWVRKTERYGVGAGRVHGIHFFCEEKYMVSSSDNRSLCLWNRGTDRSSAKARPDYDAYWVVSYAAGEQIGRMAFHPKDPCLVAHHVEEYKISHFLIDLNDIASRKKFTKLQTFKVLFIGMESLTSTLFNKFMKSGNSSSNDSGDSLGNVNIIRIENTDDHWKELFSRWGKDADVWREIFLCRLPKLDKTSSHGSIGELLLNVYMQNTDLLVYVTDTPISDQIQTGAGSVSRNLQRWVRLLKNAAPRRGNKNDESNAKIPWLLVTKEGGNSGANDLLSSWGCQGVVNVDFHKHSDWSMQTVREKIVTSLRASTTENIRVRNSSFPIFRGLMREKFHSGRRIFSTEEFIMEASRITPGTEQFRINELTKHFKSFRLPATQSGWMATAPDKDQILINRCVLDAMLVHLLKSAVDNRHKDGTVLWNEWLESLERDSDGLVSQAYHLALQDWVWSLCEREKVAATFEEVKENETLLHPKKFVFPSLASGHTFPPGGYLPAPQVTYYFSASEDDLFHHLVFAMKRSFTINKIDALWQRGLMFTTPGGEKRTVGFYFGTYQRRREYCEEQNGGLVELNLFCMDENIPPSMWQQFQEKVETLLRRWVYDSMSDVEANGGSIARRVARFFCTNRDCSSEGLDRGKAKDLREKNNLRAKCGCGASIRLDLIENIEEFEKTILREDSKAELGNGGPDFFTWLMSDTNFAFDYPQCDQLTVVFTDIKGSMNLLKERKEAGWYQALKKHFAQANALVQPNHGYMVKNMGDGFILLFADAYDALNYSYQLQQKTGDSGIKIRASLHNGPIFIDTEIKDIFGVNVGLTARIMELHKGAVILASDVVVDLLKQRKEFVENYSAVLIASVDRSGNQFSLVADQYSNGESEKVGKGVRVDPEQLTDGIKVYVIERIK